MNETQTGNRGIYRARDGAVLGVCKGIAQYLDVSLFWTRVLAVLVIFLTLPWGLLTYILAALLLKPEPVVPFRTEDDAEFYNSYVTSRSAALQRLKRTYDKLELRIRRIEDVVTNPEYDWDRRLSE